MTKHLTASLRRSLKGKTSWKAAREMQFGQCILFADRESGVARDG